MHTIQFKVLAHSLTDFELEIEEEQSLQRDEANRDIVHQLIDKLKEKTGLSKEWIRTLTIKTSSKTLQLLLETLAEKKNHKLREQTETESVLTQLFIFHFSFTPDDDFYAATETLFTTFKRHFDILKQLLYHTSISHALELKNIATFQSADSLGLSALDIKNQLKPLFFIHTLATKSRFKFKLNQKFPQSEHSSLFNSSPLSISQLIKHLQSQKTSPLHLNTLFNTKFQLQTSIIKVIMSRLSQVATKSATSTGARKTPRKERPRKTPTKAQLQPAPSATPRQTPTENPISTRLHHSDSMHPNIVVISSETDLVQPGFEPLGKLRRPQPVKGTLTLTRVSTRTRRMKHLSHQDRLHLKEKSVNLYRYLLDLHKYCHFNTDFIISDQLEDAIIDVFKHYFSKKSPNYLLNCIDYLFRKFPEQFYHLKHEIYYQALLNAYFLHKNETAESSEIKDKLQRLSITLEVANITDFTFNTSWSQKQSTFTIIELLIHLSRLRANKIGIQRIVRLVQPKSSRFQKSALLTKPHDFTQQNPNVLINLNAIQSILGRLK